MFTLAFITAFDISERQSVIITSFSQITRQHAEGKGLLFNKGICFVERKAIVQCSGYAGKIPVRKLFFSMQISPGQKFLLNFEVSQLNESPVLKSFAIWRQIDVDFGLNKDVIGVTIMYPQKSIVSYFYTLSYVKLENI